MAGSPTAVVFAQPVIQAVPERPRLVVDGHGEVKTPPDLAVIGYTVRGEGSTSDDAVRAMTKAAARIEAALEKVDRNAEPKTGDVRVTPVRSDACKEEEDSTLQLSAGPCAVLGYVTTQSVTVRSAAVMDSGTMVGLIGRGGGFNARISSFELRNPRLAQQQATAAALTDAASKAMAISAASRITLGSILNINSSGRGEGQDIVVTGSRMLISAQEISSAPPPVVVQLSPEPITTSQDVTITYAIGQ
jgi:uncharacterized protein YggE